MIRATTRSYKARPPCRATTAAFALALAATTLAPGVASASGFLTDKFGSDQGNPMTGNPFAVYFNPAALGAVRGTQLTLDVNLAYRTEDYVRSESALSTGTGQPAGDATYRDSNTGRARLSNLLASPFAGAASDFGTGVFTVGIASYVPFGGSTSWNKNSKYAGNTAAPGAVDGPQRWDSITGSQTSLYNTLAVALTIPSTGLSLGLNASYILNSISVTRARDGNGEDDIRGQNGALLEGRSYLTAKGNNIGMAGGIYYDVNQDGRIRLGASYTSRPNFGQMRLSGSLKNQLGRQVAENSYDIDFLQTLPDIIRAGVAWRLQDDVELRLDGEFVRWSAFSRQCVVLSGKKCNTTPEGSVNTDKSSGSDIVLAIPRNFQDAGGFRLSASYWANKETEVFGGGGLDTSAVKREDESPTYFDSLKVNGTIGVRRTLSKNVIIAASYNHVYYVPVDTKGTNKSYSLQIPSRSPSTNGTYDSQVMFLNLNATFLF